jgi:2-polyprenyl-6-methoxyphenol hydroxylase-like FAD-dependent oxidoreductase
VVGQTGAEVVIAGGGPAAAASAVALRSSGISVLMLVSTRPVFRMAEAIPAAALPLFEALGLRHVLSAVGVPVKGLESWLNGENPLRRRDFFVLVDRADFAKSMLNYAVLNGASTEVADRLPVLFHRGDHCVRLGTAGRIREFEAAIDATGRAALWSRPIKRRATRLAQVFQSPPTSDPQGLKLMRYESGWAYRIGLRDYMTSVLISRRVRSPELPEPLAHSFGTSSGVSTMVGHRVAGVQWAARPIQHRTIAVGDAALAHDPISGQGIRFALASALAAASVIRSWRRSPNSEAAASSFYSEFVASEMQRHLAFVDSFYETSSRVANERTKVPGGPEDLQRQAPVKVYFSGRVENAPLHIDGFIKPGHIIRLDDGGSVRWLSGFDLLSLRSLTRPAPTVTCLIELLSGEGLERSRAAAIINWCIKNRILGTISS